jgi:hypothetical protein
VYVYIYIYVCLCLCLCIYIFIYIYTHRHTNSQSAPSAHPPRHIRRQHCFFVPILAVSHYILQSQPQCNYLTQIFHYVKTPIKFPQNHNHFISKLLSPHPGPGHLGPLFRPSEIYALCWIQNPSSPRTCTPSQIKPQSDYVTFSPSSSEIQLSVQKINPL